MEAGAEEAGELPRVRARHIKKRPLKNKALSVSFDEKDLRDFVTGFHKRKKKRRKEAQQQLEEAQRRKRIEERKKRKLEREFALYGGAPADAFAEPDAGGDDSEQNGGNEPAPLASGTTTYDGGDVKVTVITSEISREEEIPSEKLQGAPLRSAREDVKKHRNVPLHKKKPFKKVAKNRSWKKSHNKKDRNRKI